MAYNKLPASYLLCTSGSIIVKRLAWYGLVPNIRKGYAAAINAYVLFCALYNKEPELASTIILKEWAATRMYGSTLPKQGQIKPDIILSYLLALKSYYFN